MLIIFDIMVIYIFFRFKFNAKLFFSKNYFACYFNIFLYEKRQQDNDILDGSSDRQRLVSILSDMMLLEKNSNPLPTFY